MTGETRRHFHQDLQLIDEKVVELFGLVSRSLEKATAALLTGDEESAQRLSDQDAAIDALYTEIEELAQRQFALQAPMAVDLRFLLSVMRIVPELERSADLAEHIGRRAGSGCAAEFTPRVRRIVERMGRIALDMWRDAAAAYGDHDPDIAAALERRDDELDDLHVSLTAELVSGNLSLPVALEMTLVARFYERLGDHAVNVAQRIRYMVKGV